MASTNLKTKGLWFEAYPRPKNGQSETVTRDKLRQWILEDQSPDGKFIVVDVRREDHEGGTIKGAINLPGQTIYPSLPTIYALIKGAGIKRVIWTCTTSRKRGNLAAGWFADFLREKGDSEIESFALLDGVLGWATAGEEFTDLMEGYEEAVWKRDHSGH